MEDGFLWHAAEHLKVTKTENAVCIRKGTMWTSIPEHEMQSQISVLSQLTRWLIFLKWK